MQFPILRSLRPLGRRFGRRPFSTAGRGELCRDFISHSLYDPKEGYFNTHKVISTPSQSLDFSSLSGQLAYVDKLRSLYSQHSESWTTSVEIFSPTFGEAVLSWILKTYKPESGPLRIFEMGAGNGTCARDIMNALQRDHPQIYAGCEYTIIEISRQLCQLQASVLFPHKDHVRIVNQSASEWNTVCPHECFFIGMEVLDNMPHDKVVITSDNEYAQIHVHAAEKSADSALHSAMPFFEEERPLSDPWIIRYLQLMEDCSRSDTSAIDGPAWPMRLAKLAIGFPHWFARAAGVEKQAIFAPTICLQFLDMLHRCFPKHHLLLQDFDTLPNAISGVNGPVVARKGQLTIGKTLDATTYLVPLGTADIFFPTNFNSLNHMYRKLLQQQPTASEKKTFHISQGNFMFEHADYARCTTQEGYNPLLQDYSNMRFFVAQHVPTAPE